MNTLIHTNPTKQENLECWEEVRNSQIWDTDIRQGGTHPGEGVQRNHCYQAGGYGSQLIQDFLILIFLSYGRSCQVADHNDHGHTAQLTK